MFSTDNVWLAEFYRLGGAKTSNLRVQLSLATVATGRGSGIESGADRDASLAITPPLIQL